jgi:pilus assembly protein Flp/PilA
MEIKMLKLYTAFAINEARIREGVKAFFSNKSGVTAIEYGLIAALVAVAIIAAVTTLGKNLGNTFNNIASNL